MTLTKIIEQPVGGDGAIVGLYMSDDGFIVEQVKYPILKAKAPAHAFVDKAIDTAEDKIPGDWDKVVLEPVRAAGHAAIDKYIPG